MDCHPPDSTEYRRAAIGCSPAGIRDFAEFSHPGLVIVLEDAQADTKLVDNIIAGRVSIYRLQVGPRTPEETRSVWEKFGTHFHQGAVQIFPGRSTMHLTGNRLSQIVLSDQLWDLVSEIAGEGQGEIGGLFETCFLTDNTWEISDSVGIAINWGITSNPFSELGNSNVLYAAGPVVKIIGNRGLHDSLLFHIAHFFSEAANAAINISSL